jgi:short-subunit dehydrogenase
MGRRRQLKGLRVLITGASQGIGRALATAAARRGARLMLVARSAELLKQLADELSQNSVEVEALVGDVTGSPDRKRIVEAAVERFGGLDVLINNAGIGATGHFCDASEDRLRKIMEVNFFALTELTRLAIPVLRGGVTPMIVNISSIAGKRGIPARTEYSASKFAVQGFTEALRAELVRFDIDVLSVCPGLTATNFSQNMLENKAKAPMDHLRSMTPEKVAEATLRAIEKGKHEIVLTRAGKILVWLSRFFPRLVDRLSARKVRQLYREEIEGRQQKLRKQSVAPAH